MADWAPPAADFESKPSSTRITREQQRDLDTDRLPILQREMAVEQARAQSTDPAEANRGRQNVIALNKELKNLGATPSSAPITTAPVSTSAQWVPPSQDFEEFEIPSTQQLAEEAAAATPARKFAPVGALKAFGTGINEGLSAGLGTYGTAGMAYIADRGPGLKSLIGAPRNGPPLSWDEALVATRAQQQATREDQPGANLAGQVLGGSGLALLSGGNTLPQLAKRGAAMGAVAGFTQNPYTTPQAAAMDTMLGAGTGAIFAPVGRLLPKGQEKLFKSAVTRDAAIQVENLQVQHQAALQRLLETDPSLKTLANAEKQAKEIYEASIRRPKYLAPGVDPVQVPNEAALAALRSKDALNTAIKAHETTQKMSAQELRGYVERESSKMGWRSNERLKEKATEVGKDALIGALAGGAYSGITGGDWVSGALHGGLGYSGLKQMAGNTVAGGLRRVLSNEPLAAPAAMQLGARGYDVARNFAAGQAINPLLDIPINLAPRISTGMAPALGIDAADNRSRLQRIADDFKAEQEARAISIARPRGGQ